ncbi:hypothetical protein Naga_100150g5 [Nannochloropsis gaditana]|uniref:Uncharacterized protein n=1 Tax=Nannochloropsis gaditana TaxID=72520 RepID=W7TRA0_9STRA|nr:hypothetical protein Naga_100150g5 [Nannochloropsis gaditana]
MQQIMPRRTAFIGTSVPKPVAVMKRGRNSKGIASLIGKYPGALAMGLLSLAFCWIVSFWRPLSSEQFARQWFENGGFLPQCNQALTFAKAASELRCYAKNILADGSVNRGLFGFNSKNSSHISDACAYDCACSFRALSSLANNRQDRKTLSRYMNSTGINLGSVIGDAGPPCNAVAEALILEGWSMLQIQGAWE